MSNNIHLHIFLGTRRLIPFTETIKQEFDNALPLIIDKLPVADVDVIVSDNPDSTVPEQGIGGYSPDAHTIYISLDPDFPHLIDSLQKEFKRTLAHELHHSLRWRNPGYGETLLDAMISEGLADHFDLEIFGGEPQPWSVALSNEHLEKVMGKATKELYSKKYKHDAWFYGDELMGISRWAGYALGFKLVKDYLQKHPSKKPSQLYSAKTNEFI